MRPSYVLVEILIAFFSPLECRSLQAKTGGFIDAEHDVHVLYGLAYGTLQQIVDTRSNQQLVVVLLHMDETLVGVHHLLQVDGLVAVVGEGCLAVELLVNLGDLVDVGFRANHFRGEDAPGKVAAIGDEVDVDFE